jgi:hypothetical protein
MIDKNDSVLADQYRISAEELYFIVNYDIKYRMVNKFNNCEKEE